MFRLSSINILILSFNLNWNKYCLSFKREAAKRTSKKDNENPKLPLKKKYIFLIFISNFNNFYFCNFFFVLSTVHTFDLFLNSQSIRLLNSNHAK